MPGLLVSRRGSALSGVKKNLHHFLSHGFIRKGSYALPPGNRFENVSHISHPFRFVPPGDYPRAYKLISSIPKERSFRSVRELLFFHVPKKKPAFPYLFGKTFSLHQGIRLFPSGKIRLSQRLRTKNAITS
jgi:hypothetical protein